MHESTIRQAKSTLTSLIHAAEKGTPVRLTRHGKPVAVLVSDRDYQALTAHQGRRDPWEFLERWRAAAPKKLAGITDREVNSWRDKSPTGGRKISWDE